MNIFSLPLLICFESSIETSFKILLNLLITVSESLGKNFSTLIFSKFDIFVQKNLNNNC